MSPLASWSLVLLVWIGVGFVVAVAFGQWMRKNGDDDD